MKNVERWAFLIIKQITDYLTVSGADKVMQSVCELMVEAVNTEVDNNENLEGERDLVPKKNKGWLLPEFRRKFVQDNRRAVSWEVSVQSLKLKTVMVVDEEITYRPAVLIKHLVKQEETKRHSDKIVARQSLEFTTLSEEQKYQVSHSLQHREVPRHIFHRYGWVWPATAANVEIFRR